jgi:hypothetical protein
MVLHGCIQANLNPPPGRASMSEVTFSDRYEHDIVTERISFTAILEGESIPCEIAPEEITRKFGRRSTSKTFEDDFLRLRPQIQDQVRKRILADRASR